MMNRHNDRRPLWIALLFGLLLVGLLSGCGDGDEASTPSGTSDTQAVTDSSPSGILVSDPWMRAMSAGMTSAAFMTVQNTNDAPVTLVAVRTDVAAAVELHETRFEGDAMRMQPVEGGIEIPAGGSVTLAPGGLHVMLINLQRDLVAGETVTLTLVFESGLEIPMDDVAVRPIDQ